MSIWCAAKRTWAQCKCTCKTLDMVIRVQTNSVEVEISESYRLARQIFYLTNGKFNGQSNLWLKKIENNGWTYILSFWISTFTCRGTNIISLPSCVKICIRKHNNLHVQGDKNTVTTLRTINVKKKVVSVHSQNHFTIYT